jgi:hypothetical protein
LDNLDKPLEFPDSPVPAVNSNKKMGHLSMAVWSADSEEDQLIDDEDLCERVQKD